ncbi:MAG: ferritin [Bradyrhizobiaceae bacterium]|nr:ferritin [Bradyrhizobiaceae bacterium]
MSIKPKLVDAINEQIATEFQSAYQYLAMSAWFTRSSLHGFAHWMQMQWQEEIAHAMKLFTFLHDRGGNVVLRGLDAPVAEYSSPQQCFEEVLRHEQQVTERIHALYELAQQERDLALQMVLQWYISEQVEEEAQVNEVLDRLRLVGTDGPAIFLLDRQLGERSASANQPQA